MKSLAGLLLLDFRRRTIACQIQANLRLLVSALDVNGHDLTFLFLLEDWVDEFQEQRLHPAGRFKDPGFDTHAAVQIDLVSEDVVGAVHARLGARNPEPKVREPREAIGELYLAGKISEHHFRMFFILAARSRAKFVNALLRFRLCKAAVVNAESTLQFDLPQEFFAPRRNRSLGLERNDTGHG